MTLVAGCSENTPGEFQSTHTARVVGVVSDSAGNPVEGIRVQLGPASDYSTDTRVTDAEGRYSVTVSAVLPDDSVRDSVSLPLSFRPSSGAHRDSVLLLLTVRTPVMAEGDGPEELVEDVEVAVP